MTLCETAAGVATVGETIRAKPLTKSAMYRCTVLAKADNAVTVQFTDPDLKKQDVQMLWNWERVQILRELTSAEQAAIKGIKRQEGIFNQIVAVFKGMQSQCIGTDSVVQLPGYAKAEVSQLLNELAAAGMKLAEADMERAWELALEQATEEAQRLAEEQKLAKQKRISEVEKQVARIYKTVELQRFGQVHSSRLGREGALVEEYPWQCRYEDSSSGWQGSSSAGGGEQRENTAICNQEGTKDELHGS
mmetsp:Transcript_72497/g.136955  ORF Transcript_72497/g.136955 Transcript_72497/m.136955 type:complete len:248 (+) Transcript_72497:34-777(+)